MNLFNKLNTNSVTADQYTASHSSRYRPFSEQKLVEEIWFVGDISIVIKNKPGYKQKRQSCWNIFFNPKSMTSNMSVNLQGSKDLMRMSWFRYLFWFRAAIFCNPSKFLRMKFCIPRNFWEIPYPAKFLRNSVFRGFFTEFWIKGMFYGIPNFAKVYRIPLKFRIP